MRKLDNYCVSFKNEAEKQAAIKFFQKFTGFKKVVDNGNGDVVGVYRNAYSDTNLGAVACAAALSDETVIPFSQIHTLLLDDNSVDVKLTESCTATVSPTGIKIGCENFSLETFDALAKAVKKVRSLK